MLAAVSGFNDLFFLSSLLFSAAAVLSSSQAFAPLVMLALQHSLSLAASSQLLTLMLNAFRATFRESLKRFL